jgi:hypothetical protein
MKSVLMVVGIMKVALVLGAVLVLIGGPIAATAESRDPIVGIPARMSLRALGECKGLFESITFSSMVADERGLLLLLQVGKLPKEVACKFRVAIPISRMPPPFRVTRKARFYREDDSKVGIQAEDASNRAEYVDVVLRGEKVLTGTARFVLKAESENIILVKILPSSKLPGRNPGIQ